MRYLIIQDLWCVINTTFIVVFLLAGIRVYGMILLTSKHYPTKKVWAYTFFFTTLDLFRSFWIFQLKDCFESEFLIQKHQQIRIHDNLYSGSISVNKKVLESDNSKNKSTIWKSFAFIVIVIESPIIIVTNFGEGDNYVPCKVILLKCATISTFGNNIYNSWDYSWL